MQIGLTGETGEDEETELSVLPKRLASLRGPLTKRNAVAMINRLVYLAAEDGKKPIPMEINSRGGAAAQSSSIIRVMDHISCPIPTFCRGEVHGGAVIIAAHGLPGFRAATPDCRFSFAAGSGKAETEEISKALTTTLLEDAARGQVELPQWMETGAEFGSEEALRLGLIDVISSKPLYPRTEG